VPHPLLPPPLLLHLCSVGLEVDFLRGPCVALVHLYSARVAQTINVTLVVSVSGGPSHAVNGSQLQAGTKHGAVCGRTVSRLSSGISVQSVYIKLFWGSRGRPCVTHMTNPPNVAFL